MKEKISRKHFFSILLSLLALPFFWIMKHILQPVQNTGTENYITEIPQNGIFIEDKVIICKTEQKIQVFSSECPHLGCRITKSENESIICPCHGSRFSSVGEVIKGPSLRNLKSLPFEIKGNKLIIKF